MFKKKTGKKLLLPLLVCCDVCNCIAQQQALADKRKTHPILYTHQPEQDAPVHHSSIALAGRPLRAQLQPQQTHKRLVAVSKHLQLRSSLTR